MGHELLIANIRVKLKKKTKRIVVPKYNVYNILVDLKSNIKKNGFALLNLTDQEQEMWTKTRDMWEEYEKTMAEV